MDTTIFTELSPQDHEIYKRIRDEQLDYHGKFKKHYTDIKTGEGHHHLVLKYLDEVVTICYLDVVEKTAIINYLLTDESHKSKGYATKTMHHILDLCETLNVCDVSISVPGRERRFYETFGFSTPINAPYEDEMMTFSKQLKKAA